MRVLLDNCVPWQLARHIAGHQVASVIHLGWDKLKDGSLLDVIDGRFDALVTVDKSIRHQQRIVGRTFALLVLRPLSNRLFDLVPLVPALLKELNSIQPGEVREVSGVP